MAFLAKYATALLLPFFIIKRSWKELLLWTGVALGGLLLVAGEVSPRGGLHQYVAHWQFNGSLFPLAAAVLSNGIAAKAMAAALLAAFSVWTGARETDPARALYVTIVAALLLAPTLHPWYLLWAIPFLSAFRGAGVWVWNATIVLSYSVLRRHAATGIWDLHPTVQLLEYVPVYGAFVWSALRRRAGCGLFGGPGGACPLL
jgi:hypothetical protein